MKTSFILSTTEAIQDAIFNHESELESLDRAIGDGDHYINMKRGVSAITAMLTELAPLTPDEALNKIGLKLLSSIGGASGPLFASFFMSMAKVLKEKKNDDMHTFSLAFSAGVEAVEHRGKASLGEKTMLDVLIPVSQKFASLASSNPPIKTVCEALINTAEQGVLSTKNLIATKGRAANLGERAIGHIDPGAKSCQVIIDTVCKQVVLNQA